MRCAGSGIQRKTNNYDNRAHFRLRGSASSFSAKPSIRQGARAQGIDPEKVRKLPTKIPALPTPNHSLKASGAPVSESASCLCSSVPCQRPPPPPSHCCKGSTTTSNARSIKRSRLWNSGPGRVRSGRDPGLYHFPPLVQSYPPQQNSQLLSVWEPSTRSNGSGCGARRLSRVTGPGAGACFVRGDPAESRGWETRGSLRSIQTRCPQRVCVDERVG